MENEVVVVGNQQFGLTATRDPNAILAEAKTAAKALKAIIESKPADKKVMMNGEQYLEFEDWATCGAFFNLAAKIVGTEYIEICGARGFLAKAVVVNTNSGIEVTAAEAMCLNDEEKWSTRPKYEWENDLDANGKKIWIDASEEEKKKGKKGHYKSTKKLVGEIAVPLFQLRSMAQTRASAKALKNVLSWVVVLAGYAPTPAEDMTGEEQGDGTTKPSEPIPGPTAKKPEPGTATRCISDAQRKRFYAIWKGAGKDAEAVKAYLREQIGGEDSALIPSDKYEAICAWAEKA